MADSFSSVAVSLAVGFFSGLIVYAFRILLRKHKVVANRLIVAISLVCIEIIVVVGVIFSPVPTSIAVLVTGVLCGILASYIAYKWSIYHKSRREILTEEYAEVAQYMRTLRDKWEVSIKQPEVSSMTELTEDSAKFREVLNAILDTYKKSLSQSSVLAATTFRFVAASGVFSAVFTLISVILLLTGAITTGLIGASLAAASGLVGAAFIRRQRKVQIHLEETHITLSHLQHLIMALDIAKTLADKEAVDSAKEFLLSILNKPQ